jgi:hypothetical protein
MRHRTRSGLAGLVVLALAACAKPTPYQPTDSGYGHEVQAIERDRFRVSFSGNAATPRKTVENYLLYRAAELTLQEGGDHFLVHYREMERHGSTPSRGTGFYPSFGIGSCWGCGWSTGVSSGIVFHGGEGGSGVQRYQAYAEIEVRRGPAPEDNPHAYDARQVAARLGPTVVRPEDVKD